MSKLVQAGGTVWLAFCRNNQAVFITSSADDGKTWRPPIEITSAVKKPHWQWYATGPGHGIQLTSGRLILPCDHIEQDRQRNIAVSGHSHIVYSDDSGVSWRLGGITEAGMNECQAVELPDGDILLSIRHFRAPKLRAFAISKDKEVTIGSPQHHPQIYCPCLQTSICRYVESKGVKRDLLLYSGPAGPDRNNLTVRASTDGGKTWPVARLLSPGPSAYSDLCVLPDGTIGCLFEAGSPASLYERIAFARFEMRWVLEDLERSPSR